MRVSPVQVRELACAKTRFQAGLRLFRGGIVRERSSSASTRQSDVPVRALRELLAHQSQRQGTTEMLAADLQAACSTLLLKRAEQFLHDPKPDGA